MASAWAVPGMKALRRAILPALLAWLGCLSLPGSAQAVNPWRFPPLPAPEQYGNILISRISKAKGVEAVGFSHWSPRLRYTCRVCHLELGFEMAVNRT